MKERRGFTLIELLVVISIIALLMAILMPSLRRARDQARSVACRSNLRNWGIATTGYAHDNGDRLEVGYDIALWVYELKPYMGYTDEKTQKGEGDVALCPSADKSRNHPEGGLGPGHGLGPLSAWGLYGGDGYLSGMSGSYAINGWVYKETRDDASDDLLRRSWKVLNPKGPNKIPLIGGNYRYAAYPEAYHAPPEFEVGAEYVGLGSFAVNRHSGFINMVFLDGNARRVGLKELWSLNLNWHRDWKADFATRTSRAGIQWPDWMAGFKDY